MFARKANKAAAFGGRLRTRQTGTGEQCSPLQKFFASLDPKYSGLPHGSLPHRLRAEPPRRGGQERGACLSESEIRRGAFYMRPRRFALPQAGTGGYGIRPYVFCRGGHCPSPAHYANITSASFTSMGVGCWFCSTAEGQYTYWTVTFN